METIIPKALKRGDKIAFISPSARLNNILPVPLSRGKAYLESLEYGVEIIFSSAATTTISDSVRIRCEEIHTAFRDTTISAIICTIGGSHANELLPFLDYPLIRSNPKIFMGYSDTTFLHYAIQSQTGLRTFYGPSVLTDFSDFPKPMQFTTDHFIHMLTSEETVGPLPRSAVYAKEHSDFMFSDKLETPREIVDSPPWRWIRKGKATGNSLCPDSWKDKIIFLESSMGDNVQLPYSVDEFRNNLVDLALSGVLNEIRGLVIGRGYKYDDSMQEELAGVVEEVFDVIVRRNCDEELPILMNVDFGHTSPFLTLPYHALVSLDGDRDEFSVLEPAVQA
ncbi:peptidase S66 LD-carboxypeptidase A [Penicillium malachiteum]|uniref:peptidase S66 LD-carboxypeptidase A n=1 Tax=Penicillium malachiteum TaxID=1324776 RepID=UPI002547F7B1|nr:peptidase S66 LD-carboxypeptidase A [Penicillium malachiteum]KAJ5726565.1 peptidase S66 LD-carboxypeptidase A [Penicillium malachiteum]